MKDKITFSIVSHGHDRDLKVLLCQLNEQNSLFGVNILVTLNKYSDTLNPSDYANLKISVIKNLHPKGFAENHNYSFSYCRTPWFAILNPDLQILNNQEPFSQMLENFCFNKNVGLIAPAVYSQKGNIEDSLRDNITPLSLLLRRIKHDQASNSTLEIEIGKTPFKWLAGMCLLVNAKAFSSIGGFNEKFKLYCEDYDLCARLYLNEYSLYYDGGVGILHNAQRESHKNPLFLYWHISSLFKAWLSIEYWRLVFLALRFKGKP